MKVRSRSRKGVAVILAVCLATPLQIFARYQATRGSNAFSRDQELEAGQQASADVLKLFVEADGGGLVGRGTSGDQVIKDSAFFAKAPHLAYGALVGAEFLFFDGWIQHHQFTDGSRIATWTQFGLGIHGTDLPILNSGNVDWTTGCISVDNDDISELARVPNPAQAMAVSARVHLLVSLSGEGSVVRDPLAFKDIQDRLKGGDRAFCLIPDRT